MNAEMKLLPPSKVGKILGIGSSRAIEAMMNGDIPSKKVGGKLFSTLKWLNEMLPDDPSTGTALITRAKPTTKRQDFTKLKETYNKYFVLR